MKERDIDELLRCEIERQLPLFETGADQQTLRAALHGLRGSISMAGYSEISLVLAQLGRRLLQGESEARLEATALLRETASRLDRGLPALATNWPTPPPGLRPSRVQDTLEQEYLEALGTRLFELDAALALKGSTQSALAQAFRSVHAMKSAASSVGDDAFAWYCHGLEGLLKPALDSESASSEAMAELVHHRAICKTWLEDPAAALDELRARGQRPSLPLRQAMDPLHSATSSTGERRPSGVSSKASDPTPGRSGVQITSTAELFDRVSRGLVYVLANTDRLASITIRGNQFGIETSAMEALELALLQLVRNAVAHGIEPPDERRRVGKNPTGQITLHAERRGDVLRLQVQDDGHGIDVDDLRRLLSESGLLSTAAAASYTLEELLPFLFVPGLSTRSEADLLGGRGLGLDIAREAVVGIGGTIRLESRPGLGLTATVELLSPGKKPSGEPRVVRSATRHVGGIRELAAWAGLIVDPAGELARSDAYLLVAETAEAEMAGFASARVTGDVIELFDLATHPAWRRRGVARALLHELGAIARENGLREIYVEVRESNLGAIGLYDKLGFERIRQRARYYKNPIEDALCLRLVL